MSKDWTDWHSIYDHHPAFQVRLKAVRDEVASFLDEHTPGPIRILSICASDGRDVLPVVAAHPRKADVQIWLIDTHEPSLQRGLSFATEHEIREQVHAVQADAGLAVAYQDIIPADLVIILGMLGHLMTKDVLNLFQRLPALCRSRGSVIWSYRNQQIGFHNIPMIRKLLADCGFRELSFAETLPDEFAVSRSRFEGEVSQLDRDEVLFQIVGLSNIIQRETPLEFLKFEFDCWVGMRESSLSKSRIELRLTGDDSGPEETKIAILHNYLNSNLFATCRLLLNPFTAWSYTPTRLTIDSHAQVKILFDSSLSFLAAKTVVDHRIAGLTSQQLLRAS